MAGAAPTPVRSVVGPFLFGPAADLAVFGGAAALSIAIAVAGPALGLAGELPLWGFVAFIVCIDVAHVYATLARTYLDRAELGRRPLLYAGVPIACFAAGTLLHALGERAFWRALAYAAVVHFVRQQIGWVAIYRARAGERDRLDRWLDDAVVYAATGYPLLVWHATLPRSFRWFIDGDFVPTPALAAAVRPLGAVYVALLAGYVARAVQLALGGRPVNVGKHVVVATTAATWYVGIVALDSDFAFTVTNVVAHGVPYVALLWVYARERGREVPESAVGRLASAGLGAFLGGLLALAFVEELLWDRLVWHERPALFGGERDEPLLGDAARALVVPLLAVPQATHYVLDAFLWRRSATTPAQARAMGFRTPNEPEPRAARASGATALEGSPSR